MDARFIKVNSTSGLNAVPSNWNNLDYENDTFILHYFELAGEVGGASGDRSSSQPTPVANLDSTQQGYGLQDITSSGTPSSLVATRTDVKTRLDNIYTKSESDLRYVNGDNFYLKTDADAKFATISNVYSKTESDSTFTKNTDFVLFKNNTDADIISINGEIGNNSATGTIKGRIQKNQNDLNTLTSRVAVNESDISSLETRADGFQTKFTTSNLTTKYFLLKIIILHIEIIE